MLIGQAEAVAREITNPGELALAMVEVAGTAELGGDLDRARVLVVEAEAASRAIIDPDAQVQALAGLAEVAERAGDLDHARALVGQAEVVACTIIHQDDRARALADLARRAAPNQARSLLAQALAASHWKTSVAVLSQVNRAAVSSIADMYLSATSQLRNAS